MKMPFKRKNNDSAVPAEIQNYYQTEPRTRSGVAWLLALGTLVITLVVALGLFFGGRFVYRKIANKNTTPVTTQQADTESMPSDSDTSSTNTTKPSASTPTPTPTPAPAPATSGATPTTPAATPQRNLPNTGPDSEE